MNSLHLSFVTSLRYLLWLGLLATGLTVLTGCASSQEKANQASARADLVTESDEPDVRRRARIRLELAVGYFEQGQTNIALDELKQSIATDPTWSEAYNLRGLIYMRLNELRLAEDSFQRALQINPREGNYLHNYGWLTCQQGRYPESTQLFTQALANPAYVERAKTWMAQGLCQVKAGLRVDGEASLVRSYELDARNPITGYNLALLLFQRGDFAKSQFYVRRINNSDLANAESLWLGIRVERRMNNSEAMQQLVGQLKKRFPQSPEAGALDRGAFDE
jgi:type IV pilus assembly protein PilF